MNNNDLQLVKLKQKET